MSFGKVAPMDPPARLSVSSLTMFFGSISLLHPQRLANPRLERPGARPSRLDRAAVSAGRSTLACHCKECQRQSGSAFGMSMIVPDDSLLVTGETKTFVRIADSGNGNVGVFCPNCGVRIYQI